MTHRDKSRDSSSFRRIQRWLIDLTTLLAPSDASGWLSHLSQPVTTCVIATSRDLTILLGSPDASGWLSHCHMWQSHNLYIYGLHMLYALTVFLFYRVLSCHMWQCDNQPEIRKEGVTLSEWSKITRDGCDRVVTAVTNGTAHRRRGGVVWRDQGDIKKAMPIETLLDWITCTERHTRDADQA